MCTTNDLIFNCVLTRREFPQLELGSFYTRGILANKSVQVVLTVGACVAQEGLLHKNGANSMSTADTFLAKGMAERSPKGGHHIAHKPLYVCKNTHYLSIVYGCFLDKAFKTGKNLWDGLILYSVALE